jgi:hypothetical protein
MVGVIASNYALSAFSAVHCERLTVAQIIARTGDDSALAGEAVVPSEVDGL